MFNSFMLRGLPMNMEGTTNTRPNVMLQWCASTDLDYELCNYGIHLTLIIESMVFMSRGLSTSYKIKIMWLCRTPSFFSKTTNVHIKTFLYTWECNTPSKSSSSVTKTIATVKLGQWGGSCHVWSLIVMSCQRGLVCKSKLVLSARSPTVYDYIHVYLIHERRDNLSLWHYNTFICLNRNEAC